MGDKRFCDHESDEGVFKQMLMSRAKWVHELEKKYTPNFAQTSFCQDALLEWAAVMIGMGAGLV